MSHDDLDNGEDVAQLLKTVEEVTGMRTSRPVLPQMPRNRKTSASEMEVRRKTG